MPLNYRVMPRLSLPRLMLAGGYVPAVIIMLFKIPPVLTLIKQWSILKPESLQQKESIMSVKNVLLICAALLVGYSVPPRMHAFPHNSVFGCGLFSEASRALHRVGRLILHRFAAHDSTPSNLLLPAFQRLGSCCF